MNPVKLLNILLVEDSESDALLLQEEILMSGIEDFRISVVQSLQDAASYLMLMRRCLICLCRTAAVSRLFYGSEASVLTYRLWYLPESTTRKWVSRPCEWALRITS
jgi:hypothetical protein